jgi:peptidoglycan/xylan/chitin deacetylase (PgdA/CDA1 family)
MTADDRSPGSGVADALLLAGPLGYLVPPLAALDYQLPSLSWAGALRRRLGIEDVTRDRVSCALTFDDGPHPAGTPAVLQALAEAGAKATFFLVGERVRANPSLAREIVAEGHCVGLHCDRHRNLMRLSPRQVALDIARAEAAIGDAIGMAPVLYRPPYGIFNAAALRIVRRRGWRAMLWSHWARDWEARATSESIASLLTAKLFPGAVLLLHDADYYGAEGSWRKTAAALPAVLERIREAGLAPTAV